MRVAETSHFIVSPRIHGGVFQHPLVQFEPPQAIGCRYGLIGNPEVVAGLSAPVNAIEEEGRLV
jgi:hypothetical protein